MQYQVKNRTAARVGTTVLTAALIFLFLIFITVPLISLFTRISPADMLTALTSPSALQALALSAATALVSTIIVILFGTPLAYINARVRYPGRNIVDTLTDLPIVLPPTVAGLALLTAFGANGMLGQYFSLFGIKIAFTTAAVVIAQIFVASPFYIRQARASFEAVDAEYEYASRTLGAGVVTTFFRVTLPLAAGSLLSGIIMTFARALGEFGATMMFAGNLPGKTQTMPLAIYGEMQSDMAVSIALSIVLVLFSFAIILIVKYLGNREAAKYA